MRFSSILFISATSLLLSCTTVKSITGPDGTEHKLISCAEIEGCYTKATEICGGKYKIANSTAETSGANGYTSTSTNLLIKCDK